VVGSGSVIRYANDLRPLSWSDGTPTASNSGDKNGIYIAHTGNGFSFTAPAGTTPQTLTVHVGGYGSGATLTAHLSDNSAPDYTNTTTLVNGQYDGNYTLNYQAGSAGQTLTVTWKMASGTGNVTLDGAALAGTSAPPSATASPTFSPASGAAFTSPQSVTLSDATSGATIYYTTDGTTPTTSSTVYSSSILVSNSETITAFATSSGNADSAVVSASYTVQASQPPAIDFSSGFTTTGLALNGNATVTGTRLQLTDGGNNEASSAYYSTPVNIQSFTTQFLFQLTSANADGFTFIIQNSGLNALGSPGGGLGSQNISKSVAVKFDLYNSAGEGTSSTGVYLNGAVPTVPSTDLLSHGIKLHSGDTFKVQLNYDGANLSFTITDTVTAATFTTAFPVNISGTVGGTTAYVGFTGGTGGATAIQQILQWTYNTP
jgi:hypothetical protein